jgi:hypothetical protein
MTYWPYYWWPISGYYCESLALLEPEGMCQERYYCPESATSAMFLDCPMGTYCPTGSAIPTLCPNGEFKRGNFIIVWCWISLFFCK